MNNTKHILLFDGICNLCHASVRFINKRDKKNQFEYLALHSEEGKEWVKKYKLPAETDSVILFSNNQVFTKSEATLEICRLLPRPWKWFVVFKLIPQKWRNGIYDWIAENRYRWFGIKESCEIHSQKSNYKLQRKQEEE